MPQGLQSIPELLARLLTACVRLLAGALAGDVHYQPYLSAKTFGVGFKITPGYRRHDAFEQRVESGLISDIRSARRFPADATLPTGFGGTVLRKVVNIGRISLGGLAWQ